MRNGAMFSIKQWAEKPPERTGGSKATATPSEARRARHQSGVYTTVKQGRVKLARAQEAERSDRHAASEASGGGNAAGLP